MTRSATPGLTAGSLCMARPGGDFAQAGQVCTVLEVLPGSRVRIAYDCAPPPHGLIVNSRHLVASTGPLARVTDPPTSEAAAGSVNVRTGHRRLVLDALIAAGDDGLTDFELAARVGIKQTSCGKRRGELVDARLVRSTGRVRPSDTQSDALVWAVTDLGLATWRELGGAA